MQPMPQNRHEMVDDLNSGPTNWGVEKTAEKGTHVARVVSFDAVGMRARVQFLGSSGSINARVAVHYQGPKSGTGQAHALYPGQLVRVQFPGGIATGANVIPEVVGTVYTEKDHRAPAYAPWHQDRTGTVQVHGREGAAYGNAIHTNENSDVARTDIGQVDKEGWANEHDVINGTNMSVAEQITRESGQNLIRLAKRFG